MSLSRLVSTAARPVALGCLLLVFTAATLTVTGGAPASHARYGGLFWAAIIGAGVWLLVLVFLPMRSARRVRVGGFSSVGLLLALARGNGLTTGPPSTLLTVAVCLAFAVAVPALVVWLEASQSKPVRRFDGRP